MGSWLYSTPEYQVLMKALNKNYMTINDENISFHKIVELTNLEYAISCTASRKDLSNTWRQYSVWCASLIEENITEPECKDAIEASRKFLLNKITEDELKAFYQKAFHAYLYPKNEVTKIQDLANSCAVDTANLDIESCILNSYLHSGSALLSINKTIEEIDKQQLDKFLEITR